MSSSAENLDMVFTALSDPTRRAVLVSLGKGPKSVSDLAKPFSMALPSFTQHLGVLEDCGLVKSQKKGRTRIVQLVPKKMQTAEKWLEKQRTIWETRLDQMDEYVLKLKESRNES